MWVGSADDALLRLYVPNKDSSSTLQVMPLEKEHFTIQTPVMAIDFLSTDDGSTISSPANSKVSVVPVGKAVTKNFLAIACQDGTVQIISWKGDNFDDTDHFRFVVDGPLLSLQLFCKSSQKEVFLVAGSLCGYVCQLQLSQSTHKWEGPVMIVQGLWNESIKKEDSVLAVHAWGNYVFVGTHAGRCILFRTSFSSEGINRIELRVAWECLLPYSIHSIVSHQVDDDSKPDATNDNSSGRRLCLIVTTRRSIHVFKQRQSSHSISDNSNENKERGKRQRGLVDLARQHLLRLLKEESVQVPPLMAPEEEASEIDDADVDAIVHHQQTSPNEEVVLEC